MNEASSIARAEKLQYCSKDFVTKMEKNMVDNHNGTQIITYLGLEQNEWKSLRLLWIGRLDPESVFFRQPKHILLKIQYFVLGNEHHRFFWRLRLHDFLKEKQMKRKYF